MFDSWPSHRCSLCREVTCTATGNLPGVVLQQLQTCCIRLKLPAGVMEASSVNVSVFWRSGLWKCDSELCKISGLVLAPEFRETNPENYVVSVMQTDRTVSPRHKPAVFVWMCLNTPLWAKLVSLGNIPDHHPPDPVFKIACIHRQQF